ncbi:hypothetical protein UA08_07912 [Talaromyces atroroseus]|uniref:Uncharacterized protein n=1 Tax=Talaromyces atroroseus TaxID=1441469 RepID=A0A225A886_TALAT|nr:hypothetical protein UA08_07912 [Talaromyces atroroseus]OKL56941.1 hypothetical protein UA08_07912 [Talaromyces atroroseus]
MNNRSRNLWSTEEDNTLRRLVEACEKDKVDWRVIASYLPGRNNKDCRKRWHYRVSASMNLGPWSQTEDDLLKMGIHRHGTHWSRVAQVVGTRNGDHRSPWTREEDRILLLAIGEYGRTWKQIVDAYFPGRTGLDAKNRQLTRKRKREYKTSASPTVKREPEQAQTEQLASLPSPSSSSSSSSPPAMRIGLVHHNVIGTSLDASQVNNHSPNHQHHHQQQLDERSVSAPSSSPYSYWELPLEEALFSPPLPTTSYSTCSSTCAGLSQLDDLQQHPLGLEQQYDESALLMNAQYPYFLAPHSRPIDLQQQQHLGFPLTGQQHHHHPFGSMNGAMTF